MNKFNRLKNTPLRNISTVIRYSGFELLRPETVDTHTMDMAVLALKVIEILGDKDIDKKDLIYRIVIHDLEESCSCDIPRSLKYYSEKVHAAIEEATKEMVKEHVSDTLFVEMRDAKDLQVLEGRIIKFLDIFQCCLVLDREVNGYGNKPLTPLLNEARSFLNKAVVQDDLFKNDPEYIRDFFRSVIMGLNNHVNPKRKRKHMVPHEIQSWKEKVKQDV